MRRLSLLSSYSPFKAKGAKQPSLKQEVPGSKWHVRASEASWNSRAAMAPSARWHISDLSAQATHRRRGMSCNCHVIPLVRPTAKFGNSSCWEVNGNLVGSDRWMVKLSFLVTQMQAGSLHGSLAS